MHTAMKSSILQPSPDLRPFVEVYLDIQASEGGTSRHTKMARLYPAPALSMGFSYGTGCSLVTIGEGNPVPMPRLSFGGYFFEPKEYYWSGQVKVFTVCFKPWGLSHLTRFPFHEGLNQSLDLYHLFGRRVHEVEGRLCECTSLYECRDVVESFLRSELLERQEDRLVLDALHTITREHGGIHIKDLASTYGLSRKQFGRRFQERVGLSPKGFSRIIRFQHTLRLLKGPIRSIEVACESGYFDQAHFIREFREMAGISPGKYLLTTRRSQLGEAFDDAVCMSPLYNTIYQ